MGEWRIAREPAWPWTVLAIAASAWLLAVFFLKDVTGPLSPDEIYFSHIFWLTLNGKRLFIDFYSQHLPAYFWLYDFILPRGARSDLSFVWWLRWSNVAVLAAYAALLFAVARRSALYYLPLLVAIVVVSRMIEIRADTVGLLAFNAAWTLLLIGKSRRSVALATVLAILSVSFSARALVMGIGFGVALLWRAWLRRDVWTLIVPLLLLGCSAAAAAAAYLTAPHYVELLVQSTLLSPPSLLSRPTMVQRVLAFDRLPQTLLTFVAMLLGIACLLKRKETERAGIIALASFTQLFLIVVDPSPFPYVYAWAMVPSLAGLGLTDQLIDSDPRKWAAACGTLCASGFALGIAFYPTITGHQAAPGSNYRLMPDPPLDAKPIAQMPVDRLTALMVSRDHQQSLANQLLVRSELCRRIEGTVLSAWQSHPICAPDATYYWFSVKWPNIGVQGQQSQPEPWFAAIFRQRPPDVFIWAVPGAPVTLNRWVRSLLSGFQVEPGFAIRRDLIAGAKGSYGTAASPPSNGRR